MLAAGPRVAVRRVARALGGPRRADRSPRGSHCARLLRDARPGAAGARDPGRPRRHVVPRCRSTCSARSGRPRTSRRRCPTCRSRTARTTCSPASARRRRPTRSRPSSGLSIAYDGTEAPAVNTPSTSVSPGLGGFIAFFLLAVALWLLMRNMNKRMRRMTYREEQEAAARAEAAARRRRPARRAHRGPARGQHRSTRARRGPADDRPARAATRAPRPAPRRLDGPHLVYGVEPGGSAAAGPPVSAGRSGRRSGRRSGWP